ncbi:MAG: hypothetical protein GY925_16825 [Actinomycetia bacterium]|nr:hypothetical protein [Actinomycetes bacterium]
MSLRENSRAFTSVILASVVVVLLAGCSPATGSTADTTSTSLPDSTTTTVGTSPAPTTALDTPTEEPPSPSSEEPPSSDQSRDVERQPGVMDIENTLSDRAQLTTIAFDALAFLTGNECTDSFFPPGKVSDFFGFQYLRDNTPDGYGHNTAFAGTIGANVLSLLDQEQLAQMVELAGTQTGDINDYGYARFPLMDAFRRLLADDLPAGAGGLSTSAVAEYSAEVYALDGQISFDRAAVFTDILNSLTPTQAEQLADLAATNVAEWPDADAGIDELKRQLERDEHVALITYAGQMFSWYVGGIDADTYFCPERHGTYFGSFYLKDIPAMLSQWEGTDVTINENLTGDYGNQFLDLLDTEQRDAIESLTDVQRPLMEELVETREAIAAQLRRLWDDSEVDRAAVELEVLALSERYGELDGEIVALYATTFDQVYESLTTEQTETLWSYRQSAEYLGLIDDPCSLNPDDLAYLYSEAVDMPEIGDTDRFFALP